MPPKKKKTNAELEPLTHEQVDKLFAKLKQQLGDFSVLNDVIFKHLFGEPGKAEPRLMSLLNAVRKQMQQPLITKVTIESATNYPTNPGDKITFLDIKARDEEDRWYNVEVQLIERGHFVRRVVYYNAKVHSSQLDKGDGYEKLRPTISIVLTDFLLFEDLPGSFQPFRITSETNPDYVLTDDVQYVFIQFGGKLTPEMLKGLVVELADWIKFLNFKRMDEATMKKVLFANPMVASTSNVLTDFVSNKKSRQLIEDAEKHRRDYDWAMQCERREGELKGQVEAILAFLEGRFGSVPKLICESLNKRTDLTAMKSLVVLAATCKSLDEFENALK
ncbi:MAG: Rpn family recombination-promoting nuclease/putative transposase [Thermoguttaceae bacterium]